MSSATNHGINSTNTSFTVHVNPPLQIPENATSARAFIQTATIPYVTPNVVSGKNSLYVRLPIKDSDGDDVPDGGRDVQITIPPGLYSLTGSDTASLEDAINEAVNKQILDDVDTTVGVGEFMLQDPITKKANFCTLKPNYALNRVQLTFNHTFTGIDFADTRTTLDILGFTQNCLNEVPKFTAKDLSFTVTMSDTNTQTFAISDGVYTARQLENEVNTKCIASNNVITKKIIKAGTLEVFIESILNHATGGFVDYKTGRFEYEDKTHVTFTKYSSKNWPDAGGGDPAGTNPALAGNAPISGKVATASVQAVGSNYTTGNALTTTTNGSGAGLTVNITHSTGAVDSIAINDPGTGYIVGETVSILQPSTQGQVDTVTVTTPGSNYKDEDGLATTTAVGPGLGLTLNITTTDGAITNIAINSAGTGYRLNDIITVTQDIGFDDTNPAAGGVVTIATLVALATADINTLAIDTYNGMNIHAIFGQEHTDGLAGTNRMPSLLVTAKNEYSVTFTTRTDNVWSTSETANDTFLAKNRATLDKVTEVGIACNPLIKGGVTSAGQPAAGVLARFQIEGSPGAVMTFKPNTVIKSDISQFIGTSVDKLSFSLVDQDSNQITDLQEEHWAAVMVVEFDTP